MAEDEVRIVSWQHIAMLCVTLIAVLLFIAGVIAAMYFGARWLGLQAAIAWAVFVLLAFLLVRLTRERISEHRRVLADKKREQYFELVEVLRKCFFADDPVLAASKQRQELQRWSLRLALLGSDEVLRAWGDFCDNVLGEFEEDEQDDQEEEDALFSAQARLVQALRRDCGHAATRVTRRELAELLADEESEEEV